MEIVKVFKNTKNALPEGCSAFAAAKDIRADIKKIDPNLMFNAVSVWVKPTAKTGLTTAADYNVNPNVEEYTIRAVIIMVNGRVLIPSGFNIQLPKGYSSNIRPRSGLSLKYGLIIVNSPGTIDEDYRGDVGIILSNQGNASVIIVDGERIAQMKLEKDIEWEFEEVDTLEELTNTDRGTGGFGSTGTH